jgi:hypothetical protein
MSNIVALLLVMLLVVVGGIGAVDTAVFEGGDSTGVGVCLTGDLSVLTPTVEFFLVTCGDTSEDSSSALAPSEDC